MPLAVDFSQFKLQKIYIVSYEGQWFRADQSKRVGIMPTGFP